MKPTIRTAIRRTQRYYRRFIKRASNDEWWERFPVYRRHLPKDFNTRQVTSYHEFVDSLDD